MSNPRINQDLMIGKSDVTLADINYTRTKLNNANLKFKSQTNYVDDMGPDTNYQIPYPNGKPIFVEPLFNMDGTDFSGGHFVIPGSQYTYIPCKERPGSGFTGVYVYCSYDLHISISAYCHCGTIIKGFRTWYLDKYDS